MKEKKILENLKEIRERLEQLNDGLMYLLQSFNLLPTDQEESEGNLELKNPNEQNDFRRSYLQ